jgi:hypothetical protein
VPVILCAEWTDAQVKAFRLMVNRSVTWADWDEELLGLELLDLNDLDFDLSLTGFAGREIDDLLAFMYRNEHEDTVPDPPEHPVARPGDLCSATIIAYSVAMHLERGGVPGAG